MTLNLDNEHTYFTEIAKRAYTQGITCFRFIPSNINPHTEIIDGEVYDPMNHEWIKKSFPLPDLLYDRCFYREDFHSKKCKAIVDWLKAKKHVQFLGFGLPNKLELYQILSSSNLAPYIPKTVRATSPDNINTLTEKMGKVVLKPINGSQGNGVYYIEKRKNEIVVKTDKRQQQVSRTFTDVTLWKKWLQRILSQQEFILQPFLLLQNDHNQPFDIRSLLQKNTNGEWTLVGSGIRVGKENGIVSNLSAGATSIPFQEWIQSGDKKRKRFIKEEIQDILQNLPSVLEEKFPPLFELGVDIGVAQDQSIWILDINSKPGRKVLLQTQPDLQDFLYESPLLYAKFLKERSYPFHEKTLSD